MPVSLFLQAEASELNSDSLSLNVIHWKNDAKQMTISDSETIYDIKMELGFFERRRILKNTSMLYLTPFRKIEHRVVKKMALLRLYPKFKKPGSKQIHAWQKVAAYHLKLDESGTSTWLLMDGRRRSSHARDARCWSSSAAIRSAARHRAICPAICSSKARCTRPAIRMILTIRNITC